MKFPPYQHQKVLFDRMLPASHLVGAECGTGKTYAGLAIAERRAANPTRSGKTLVVAPLPLLEAAWMSDAQKFCPELKVSNLWGRNAAARRKKCEAAADADVCLINYESFKLIERWLNEQDFDNLILDESTRIKNQVKTARVIVKFARSIPYVYPMSGTVMPNGYLDLFNQVDVVKPGILGVDFWQYRGRWFIAHGQNRQGHKFDYRPRAGAEEEIMNLVKPHATFLAKKDCLDLPEKVFVTRKYVMPKPLRDAYDTMVKDKILPLVEDREAIGSNTLAEIMKLRQLTSGWTYDTLKNHYVFDQSKAELLDEVLEEIGNQQAIIWVQFRHDAQQLAHRLGALKIIGGMNPKELQENIRKFSQGEVQYVVAHPATIAHGVTWTNCSYCVYYSLSYNLEHWKQSQDRIHRIGTTNKCTYVSLLAENSIDETIYRALNRKETMSHAALEYLKTAT